MASGQWVEELRTQFSQPARILIPANALIRLFLHVMARTGEREPLPEWTTRWTEAG